MITQTKIQKLHKNVQNRLKTKNWAIVDDDGNTIESFKYRHTAKMELPKYQYTYIDLKLRVVEI